MGRGGSCRGVGCPWLLPRSRPNTPPKPHLRPPYDPLHLRFRSLRLTIPGSLLPLTVPFAASQRTNMAEKRREPDLRRIERANSV
jgi:hypothetical protein